MIANSWQYSGKRYNLEELPEDFILFEILDEAKNFVKKVDLATNSYLT